jgi:hypothetical protein
MICRNKESRRRDCVAYGGLADDRAGGRPPRWAGRGGSGAVDRRADRPWRPEHVLYDKDRRAGTLDLAAADPVALDSFLQTGSIRLTRLFHDADARADTIRQVQAIHLVTKKGWPSAMSGR